MTIAEAAPAKLNLALHVTGQRADGYHLLDSLVVFAAAGDLVRLDPGPLSLRIDGQFGAGLSVEENLCLDAARLAGAEAAITLTKNLPVASGIGGGSADAAAVLRGLARRGTPLPDRPERLGADVPVCVVSEPRRMRGVGEVLDPVPALPDLHLVLINPGVGISTPQIFKALDRKDNPPLPPLPDSFDLGALVDYLQLCRNDLQAPAVALCPQIGDVLTALQDEGALLARMSGSGATCFGIFPDAATAGLAAYRIGTGPVDWWITATGLAAPPAPF
ncbi:4-(cytidine 5'-diphospho)-2-C-methyl-D-erythritol kinase [Paracoccus xiamenensis]|uniref:4-(cytidine 5'-diphospho)-2-C-methyl-D-erythritol kinase n=1 Tax=Paracoccus xiamenensis TaxID=2714901 RepID=UPI00140A9609|nr:4-(cytidine 5'-diphospho)-2-C-methyl-D-erythritol kinase [Paracoccus xiamenensis]NHF73627.1 4-(cytidine 5'-diphospho)-2-C-methyl-D-erythritol kinase [Paracoccus xiamenensis]